MSQFYSFYFIFWNIVPNFLVVCYDFSRVCSLWLSSKNKAKHGGSLQPAHLIWNSAVFLWLRGASNGQKWNNSQSYTSSKSLVFSLLDGPTKSEFQIRWAVGEDQCLTLFLKQSYNEWTLISANKILLNKRDS